MCARLWSRSAVGCDAAKQTHLRSPTPGQPPHDTDGRRAVFPCLVGSGPGPAPSGRRRSRICCRNVGTLVLLRHGESAWNADGLFTGWVDVGLSAKGESEAAAGGKLLLDAGMRPGIVHTSVLTRAIQTANISLDTAGWGWLPVRRSWRLNERHYGALQGRNK